MIAGRGKRIALGLALIALIPAPVHPIARAAGEPNVVVIVTDDQRWDTLWAMPTLQSDLAAHGVTFDQAFVANSLCCPSRSTILTGKYSHTTHVYMNGGRYGGFRAFDDSSTLATWLHDDGYRTGLIGKYLNGYFDQSAFYIPPGWDRWFAFTGIKEDGYYNYSVSDDGVLETYGSDPEDYSTDVLATTADDFIRGTDPGQPLFLYFAPHAPHAPAVPPERYLDAFSHLNPYRPPSYNEDDVSDKPAYIQAIPKLNGSEKSQVDQLRINQYRTLLAVDDAIGTILTALSDTGRLSNTLILFMSDNGQLWGEHRWTRKEVPYEESIRVPMVIRYDPLTSTPNSDEHLVVNVDVAPTIADAAGVSAPGAEGMSLMPLLSSFGGTWRKDFLVEHLQGDETKDVIPTYCAERNASYSYITYGTGEEELYDLAADPYQLDNVAADPGYASVLATARARLKQICKPTPPGFHFPYWAGGVEAARHGHALARPDFGPGEPWR